MWIVFFLYLASDSFLGARPQPSSRVGLDLSARQRSLYDQASTYRAHSSEEDLAPKKDVSRQITKKDMGGSGLGVSPTFPLLGAPSVRGQG